MSNRAAKTLLGVGTEQIILSMSLRRDKDKDAYIGALSIHGVISVLSVYKDYGKK